MGKTVESYRMALESEIGRWNSFSRALRIEERQSFEVLMDTCQTRRNRCLQALTAEKANAVASLKQTGHDRRLVLEKHPHSILGYAVLLSETQELLISWNPLTLR